MAQQTINVGAAPNDGTGTPLRTAFQYTNSNFSELYTAVGPSGNNIVVPGNATITGDLTVDTSTLKVDSANNRVGILTTTPAYALDVNGDAKVTNALRYFVGSTQYGLSFANAGALGVESYQGTYIFLGTGAGASATERFRIANDGVCTWSNVGGVAGTAMTLNSTGLGVGVTPSASGGCLQLKSGITFPATQVASSDANTLDDYEEGTWTPTVGGTATYTTQSGRYTKIGNRVYVNMRLEILLIGTGSSFLISGLPFTSAISSNLSSASVGYFSGLAISANYIAGYIASGGSTVRMTGTTAASANITNGITVIGDGTDIALSFFYEV